MPTNRTRPLSAVLCAPSAPFAAALCACLALFASVGARAEKPAMIAVLEFELAEGVKIDRVFFSDEVRGAIQKRAPQLFVMTRESTDQLLKAAGKSGADCEGECEVETGRKLGADFVVSGRITRVGSRMILTMRLHSTADGRMLRSGKAVGRDADALFDQTGPAIADLLAALPGVASQPAPERARAVEAPASAPPQAAQVNVAPEPAPAARPAAPPALNAHRHLGFYLRFEPGLGYMSSNETAGTDSLTISGAAGGFGVAAGYALFENFIVAAHLFDSVAVSPSVNLTTASGTASGTASNGKVTMLGLGGQVTYYFSSNLYLSGSVGLSALSVDSGSGAKSADNGLALQGAVGYEWWASDHWGLGAAAQVSGATNGDANSSTGATNTITTTAFTLAFSATWN